MHASVRVLIIEPYEDARTLLCDFLQRHDFHCVQAASIGVGIEAMQALETDVVIVEWFSSRLTDAVAVMDLVAEPRKLQGHVRILVLSTVPRPGDFADVDGYMLKPAPLDRLLAVVKTMSRHN